jgi:hypothetical protein
MFVTQGTQYVYNVLFVKAQLNVRTLLANTVGSNSVCQFSIPCWTILARHFPLDESMSLGKHLATAKLNDIVVQQCWPTMFKRLAGT